jgi:lysozyme family protein
MSASSYDEALARLLADEGGYSNHPSDPGGPTNFGITIADYRKYVKPDATAADVRAMKVAEAKRIYRDKYWDAMRCDALPAGVDYGVFDYGVNSGIGRAGKVLRRMLDLPDDSSAVTDAVVQAAAICDPKALVAAIYDERLRFLKSLKTWPVFGNGWSRRVAEGRVVALAMAGTPVRSVPVAPSQPAPGKGAVVVNDGARKTTAGGAIAAGGAAAAQSSEASTVVAILVVAVAVAIGGWLFWHWWQKRQQEAPTKPEPSKP